MLNTEKLICNCVRGLQHTLGHIILNIKCNKNHLYMQIYIIVTKITQYDRSTQNYFKFFSSYEYLFFYIWKHTFSPSANNCC